MKAKATAKVSVEKCEMFSSNCFDIEIVENYIYIYKYNNFCV